jgi:hypothetical protein
MVLIINALSRLWPFILCKHIKHQMCYMINVVVDISFNQVGEVFALFFLELVYTYILKSIFY